MATDDAAGHHDAAGRTLTDAHAPGKATAAGRTPPGRSARGDASKTRDRIARRQADKFTERREQLAAVASATLAEYGYANTSLRDIAERSEFSHGVLHYYFEDKFELITFCVRKYKTGCITKYDAIIAGAASAEELRDKVSAAMADTLREDATMQRLWYDLRNQSQFDERLRATVQDIDNALEEMIWRIVRRYADLQEHEPAVTPAVAYALVDGLFQHAMLRPPSDGIDAADVLDAHVWSLLPDLVKRQGRRPGGPGKRTGAPDRGMRSAPGAPGAKGGYGREAGR